MVQDCRPLDVGLAVAEFLEGQVDLERDGGQRLRELPPHQHAAAVQRLAPGVVEELPGQLRLARSRDTLAEQHLADHGEFTDGFEALQEADLRVDVGFQLESVAMGPQPFQRAGSDVVDQAGVGHPSTPCPPGRWCVPARAPSSSRPMVRVAAKAAMRVGW
ncbi:hypothetical protein SAFG77S_08832 [Streptomyces afghaniensis]